MAARYWFCIYTKNRHEDQVCRSLHQIEDIEVLNARFLRPKYIRGRLKHVEEQLFPRYIFLKFDPSRHYHLIQYTRGVARILSDSVGNPCMVDEIVIAQIQSRMRNGYVMIEPDHYRPGDNVVIRQGALKGIGGVFLNALPARDRVLILLNSIAYQAKIDMDRSCIAAV